MEAAMQGILDALARTEARLTDALAGRCGEQSARERTSSDGSVPPPSVVYTQYRDEASLPPLVHDDRYITPLYDDDRYNTHLFDDDRIDELDAWDEDTAGADAEDSVSVATVDRELWFDESTFNDGSAPYHVAPIRGRNLSEDSVADLAADHLFAVALDSDRNTEFRDSHDTSFSGSGGRLCGVDPLLSNPHEKVRNGLVGGMELFRDVRLLRLSLTSPDQVLDLRQPRRRLRQRQREAVLAGIHTEAHRGQREFARRHGPHLVDTAEQDFTSSITFAAGKDKVAAGAKHCVGDGGTQNGLNENNTIIDRQGMVSIPMPAYLDALRKGISTGRISYSNWNALKVFDHMSSPSKKLPVNADESSDWKGVQSTELDEAFSAASVFVAVSAASSIGVSETLQTVVTFGTPSGYFLYVELATSTTVHATLLDFKQALLFCHKALELHESTLGKNSMAVAHDRHLLGATYTGLEQHEQALEQNQISQKAIQSWGAADLDLLHADKSIGQNLVDSSLKYLDLMLKSGYIPSPIVFTDNIQACVSSGRWDTLTSIIEKCKTTDKIQAWCPQWAWCVDIAEAAFSADSSTLALGVLEFLASWFARGQNVKPPVSSGPGNVSMFLWDPGGHAKNSLGTSCILRSGECQVY